MPFYDWVLSRHEYKRNGYNPGMWGQSVEDIYQELFANIEANDARNGKDESKSIDTFLYRLRMEYTWEQLGCPYYNVHPCFSRSLRTTKLQSIPMRSLARIGGFSVVLLRFSDPVPEVVRDLNAWEKYESSILQMNKMGYSFPVRSALIGSWCSTEADDLINPEKATRGYFMIPDSGVIYMDSQKVERVTNFTAFSFASANMDEAVDACINSSDFLRGGRAGLISTEEKAATRNLFLDLARVVVSTGFLANAPDDMLIFERDVLGKDKAAYREALHTDDNGRVQVIENRAQRRGKLGWNLGTNEMFVSESELSSGPVTAVQSARQLKWSHIRGGHPHAVRYGEGKRLVKIKWYRPTRVREDLPFQNVVSANN